MILVMIKAKPSAMEGITRNSAKVAAFFFLAVFSFAQPAAAELATLRNGYSIRHDHHMVMGATTRLYLSADDSSFTDVPTEEITGFEKELALPDPSTGTRSREGSTTANWACEV